MPRVVVVGAGLAGVGALRGFVGSLSASDGVDVVVFERNEFFYHTYGAARALTDKEYQKCMFIPYDNLIPSHKRGFVRIERAVVTAIAVEPNQEVTYASIGTDDKPSKQPQTMAFDYLILATGSTYTAPIKHDALDFSRANMEFKLSQVHEHIVNSKKILVVGGGAVGCEVAADIAGKFPDKKVTLVSSSPILVAPDNVKESFRSYLLDSLAALNIEVFLGERLEERLTGNVFEKRTLRTDKGTEIESDIQLLCAGFSPASELVRSLDASLVDSKGAIKVNASQQLDDSKYPHIFALGDASNHETAKMGYLASRQGRFVATEIIAVIRGSKPEVSPYLAPTQSLILPLGPNGGVSQFPIFGGLVLGNWFTWLVKSRDMKIGSMRRLLNAKSS